MCHTGTVPWPPCVLVRQCVGHPRRACTASAIPIVCTCVVTGTHGPQLRCMRMSETKHPHADSAHLGRVCKAMRLLRCDPCTCVGLCSAKGPLLVILAAPHTRLLHPLSRPPLRPPQHMHTPPPPATRASSCTACLCRPPQQMTYVKQLEAYEDAVMKKRVDEMTEAELAELAAEVDSERSRKQQKQQQQ